MVVVTGMMEEGTGGEREREGERLSVCLIVRERREKREREERREKRERPSTGLCWALLDLT